MNSYERFMERLATVPIPSPRTTSGVEIEILKRIMTPTQAEFACLLTAEPEALNAICRRTGVSSDALGVELERLVALGVVFKVYADPPLYSLVAMVPGIWEFRMNKNTPEDIHLWERYYYEKQGAEVLGNKTPFLRVVPVKQSVPANVQIYTYEEVDAIIENAGVIALADCVCRVSKKMIGEGCDAPVKDMCIFLDAWADYYVENKIGRPASKEEARETIERSREAGLVCNTINARQGSFAICNCCGCCCFILRGINELAMPGSIAKSNFIAEIASEQCTGCGTCVERCHVKALVLEGDAAELIEDRCIGCGACDMACPFGAISLKRRTVPDSIPAYVNELMATIAGGRKS
ncbi:MAG: hypothetical protein VR64_12290 [Desulfatitalea sp. BRH_c12]|nr:MAG: hypothetical protein VR64_12290 [Desulfatitalea sp. BRH_c12]